VQNTVAAKPTVDFQKIKKFITSLQKASKLWYCINNPKQSLSNELITEEESIG
jgi:hypothetical protein